MSKLFIFNELQFIDENLFFGTGLAYLIVRFEGLKESFANEI